MKALYFFIWICFLQQNYSQGSDSPNKSARDPFAPECITTARLIQATVSACKRKENTDLWKKIIDCHRPMTDTFLRFSAEARCPITKHVENPTDTNFTIHEVFFNICGIFEGNSTQLKEGIQCLVHGRTHPYIMDHETEVAEVKSQFGKDVPCNIGKCVLDMDFNV